MHTSAKLAVIVIEERGKSPHVLVVPMRAPLYLIIIMDQRTDYTTLQSKASRIELFLSWMCRLYLFDT